MTFEMLQIMHALWLEQGISQQTLAFNTVRDKASLTSLINNLEKKDWWNVNRLQQMEEVNLFF